MVVGMPRQALGTRSPGAAAARAGVAAVAVVLALSAASMAGLPLEAGFIAKEEAYAGLRQAGSPAPSPSSSAWWSARRSPASTAPACVWGVLVSPRRSGRDRPRRSSVVRRPAAALGVVTVVLGIVPAVAERSSPPPSRASCRSAEVDLALWHGVNLPLVLSVVTIAAGAVCSGCGAVARVLAAGERVPSSANAYFAVLRDSTSRPTRDGCGPECSRLSMPASSCSPRRCPGAVLLTGGLARVARAGRRPAHLPVAAVVIGAASPRRSATAVGGALPRSRRLRHGCAVRRRVLPTSLYPGGDRDPVDGAVRPGAAHFGPVRAAVDAPASRRPPGGVGHRLRHGLRLRPARRFERTPPTWCRPRWSSGRSPTGTATTSST